MKYYEVHVTMTGKAIDDANDENYSVFHKTTEKFSSLSGVKDYIKDNYKGKKREKMYVDTNNGAKHIGYTYTFKDRDWSHNNPEYWRQDWIEIREIKATTIII